MQLFSNSRIGTERRAVRQSDSDQSRYCLRFGTPKFHLGTSLNQAPRPPRRSTQGGSVERRLASLGPDTAAFTARRLAPSPCTIRLRA